ncbi:NAD-dependent epimerase/dehydratase family protein [Nocardioides soli]|uniref:UDP-glucose 4-epimerase n=1 Tax=Nocardioides soli TaxID=1036020 RepID=A0A7W4W027_9ACTN|nr:UDP-glucose 4-epimerase [Nocardioides soli]
MTTLLVGRGLLGGHVEERLRATGDDVHTVAVPWADHAAALGALRHAAEIVGARSGWRLAWCAGAGVVATPAAELAAEVRLFGAFVGTLTHPPASMFLASSAGGLYAGSPDPPPFDEGSTVAALAPYGVAKLDMEELAGLLTARGTRLLVGRISNLYGPGQDLSKPQGLIAQLCLAHETRRTLNVHVSLDTLRDYLFVDDAAAMIVAGLDLLDAEPPGTTVTKVLASGRAASIAAVVAEATRVLRRHPRLSTRQAAGGQVRDLRLRSVVWPEVDAMARTPFAAGLRATADDVAARTRSAAGRSTRAGG